MIPLFSVVVTVYNKSQFVERTIKSILNQTISDFELVIVDDGSTDDSLEVINTLNDSRIMVFPNKNQGVSSARNFGLKKAKGHFIALCDGDDIWLDNHLSELKTLIETYPHCGIYATSYEKHYFKNYIKQPVFNHIEHPFFGIVDDYFKSSLKDNILWTSAIALPKTTIDQGYIFKDDLGWGEDTDLWIRIACDFKIAFSSKPTALKMIHSTQNHLSLTKNIPNLMKMLKSHEDKEKSNPSLKVFLDINRFMVAMEAKLRNDYTNYKKVKKDINLKNLNPRLKLLLFLPAVVLRFLKRLKFFLLKNKLYRSPF